MDILQQLGTALGIGLLSGIRLYLTVLSLGTAIRLHWITLDADQNGLAILGDWRVMAAAGVACAIEFIADKVPWVDSFWDSVHTFIRPIGAAILGARVFTHTDPALQAILAILCVGVALSSHSAKAATRLAANHSPEPFSNIALSLAGDLAVPIATWTAFHFPLVTLVCTLACLALFAWLAPKALRTIRLELSALRAAIQSWFGSSSRGGAAAESSWPLPAAAGKLPVPLLRALHRVRNGEAPMGVRAAATRSIPGLDRSLGYLFVDDQQVRFETRRLLRGRTWSLQLDEVSKASWNRGLLLDQLCLTTAAGDFRFYVLKGQVGQGLAPAIAAESAV